MVMACRSLSKCKEAAESIRSNSTSIKDENVVPMVLDTSSLKSVDDFDKEFLQRFDRLDYTIFNGKSDHGSCATIES